MVLIALFLASATCNVVYEVTCRCCMRERGPFLARYHVCNQSLQNQIQQRVLTEPLDLEVAVCHYLSSKIREASKWLCHEYAGISLMRVF